MTPQEHALLLINRFRSHADWNNEYGSSEEKANIRNAKECAKISCQEIIAALPPILGRENFGPNSPLSAYEAMGNPAIDYWTETLKSIDTL